MTSITVKVLYFASIREEIGKREEALLVPVTSNSSVTLGAVRAQLCLEYPDAAASIQQITLALNLEYSNDDTVVKDGDEVALIPPISGG